MSLGGWQEITIVNPDDSGETTLRGTIQQAGSSESDDTVDFTNTNYLLMLPYPEGSPLTAASKVLCDEDEYEVVSKPWFIRDELRNYIHHIEANLVITGKSDAPTEFQDEESF